MKMPLYSRFFIWIKRPRIHIRIQSLKSILYEGETPPNSEVVVLDNLRNQTVLPETIIIIMGLCTIHTNISNREFRKIAVTI